MKRRLLNLLTVASLLLGVAIVVMWMRSDRKRDCLSASGPHWASAVESDAGRLSVVITWYEAPKPLPGWQFALHHQKLYWDPTVIPAAWAAFGFEGRREIGLPSMASRQPRWTLSAVTVPYWAVFGAGLPAPLLTLIRRVCGRWRRGQGRCPFCSYDLRATPGRCPECGHMPAGATA